MPATIGAFYLVTILITYEADNAIPIDEETEAQRQHSGRKQLKPRALQTHSCFHFPDVLSTPFVLLLQKWKQGAGTSIGLGNLKKKKMGTNLRKRCLEQAKILEIQSFCLQIKLESHRITQLFLFLTGITDLLLCHRNSPGTCKYII